MKILYIDTSTSYLYAGISILNELVASCKIKFNTDLSKYTLSEVNKLFQKANLKPNDIDKIIVVSGPGSFTGIRIGMTIAKIFAWSLNKEITTITSLEAMAISTESNKIKVPILDARRGYVYAGVYQNEKNILENQYICLETLEKYLKELNKEYIYITNDDKISYPNTYKYDPDILKIINFYKDKTSINPHLVEPTYLKLTEAEENLGNKNHDN